MANTKISSDRKEIVIGPNKNGRGSPIAANSAAPVNAKARVVVCWRVKNAIYGNPGNKTGRKVAPRLASIAFGYALLSGFRTTRTVAWHDHQKNRDHQQSKRHRTINDKSDTIVKLHRS